MKTDIHVKSLVKRLDNLIHGSSPSVSKWNDYSKAGPSNWDMINAIIKEHPDDSWYVPKEDRYNAWSSPVISGLGNIELRDFELERKFQDMRCARVEEYDKQCDDAIERKDFVTYDKLKQQVPPIGMFWCNWSKEELEYYEDTERFPKLKEEGYRPNWIKEDIKQTEV